MMFLKKKQTFSVIKSYKTENITYIYIHDSGNKYEKQNITNTKPEH